MLVQVCASGYSSTAQISYFFFNSSCQHSYSPRGMVLLILPPFNSAGTCLIQDLSCSRGVGGRCFLLLERNDAQCKLGSDGRQREAVPQLPLPTGLHPCWCHQDLQHLRQVSASLKPILSERSLRKTHGIQAQPCCCLGLGHGAMAGLPHLGCWIWPHSLAV